MTLKPAHIIGTSRATWTLCGIRVVEAAALPYTLARYVADHQAHGRTYCPDCLTEGIDDGRPWQPALFEAGAA